MTKFSQTDFILDAGLLIPVLALDADETLEPLAEALVAGGIQVFEIVLRTPTALEVIARLRGRVPILGAGTVLDRTQMDAAKSAGAQFCVSPGLTPALHQGALDLTMPLLPGAVTASEVMAARELGYQNLKFFPAERAGGAQGVGDFKSVFPDVRFCPTGGINQTNARDYLAHDNVRCIGGSLATPAYLIKQQDWDGLRAHVAHLIRDLDLCPAQA